MMLSCERVRAVLWPLDRPRNHLPEEEAARNHLATCGGCRAFFLRDAELSRILKRIGEGVAVSPSLGLHVSVARALASHGGTALGALDPDWLGGGSTEKLKSVDRSSWRRFLGGWRADVAAAAAAILLLGGGQLLAERYEAAAGDHEKFAADYVRSETRQAVGPGLEPIVVARFYEKEMGRPIRPVALGPAPVTRAAVCDLEGESGSMIEYDLAGKRLVHYRIPLDQSSADAEPSPVEIVSLRGVQVARWVDGVFENALVADVPSGHLAWLAETRFIHPR
jgi:hypothetical protein